jgi:phosphinothricin acetyltransferase
LTNQGFYVLYAVIALPNRPSVKLHTDFGFERVGFYENAGYKHGEWHDVGHWERVLKPHKTSPSPPVPFAEFRNANDIDNTLRTGEPVISLECD